MLEKSVPIIVALLVGWFAHAIFFPPQEFYDFDEAGEVCHQAQQDQWQETAVLEITDDWKAASRAINGPGWLIWGSAFAVGEDGATSHFGYGCTFKFRDLKTVDLWKTDPPEDRD